MHDPSLSRSAAHFFIVCAELTKENSFFRSMELDSWLSSKLKKLQKYFSQYV